jgi:hypothetical protein
VCLLFVLERRWQYGLKTLPIRGQDWSARGWFSGEALC